MTNNKFNIDLPIETIRELRDLIEFCHKNFPYIPPHLWTFYNECNQILNKGCFKHNTFRQRFRISKNETISICVKCDPKQYDKLKKSGIDE